MFITMDKIKKIGIILLIILILGVFSKIFKKPEKEGFQMDTTVVKIADSQKNVVSDTSSEPVPNYEIEPSDKIIKTDISQNKIMVVPEGRYIVDGSIATGGNIASLPTGNKMHPFPPSMTTIPVGYFKYRYTDNLDYLAPIPLGYYIVENNDLPRKYNMSKLPNANKVTLKPDIAISSIPEGYYIRNIPNNPPIGLTQVPTGYYIINQTDMAPLPSGDTVTVAPEIGIPGIYIPYGYYITSISNKNWLSRLPYGYRYAKNPDGITDDRTQIVPYTNKAIENEMQSKDASGNKQVNSDLSGNMRYNMDNYNVEYHDSAEKIQAETDTGGKTFGSMYVKDVNGKIVQMPYVQGQEKPVYYTPGSFVFGPSNYVPNYEDSVYLSRTTGLSTVSTAVPAKSSMGGFCMSTNKTEIEQTCNAIPADQCASTSCCVLLGGTKCVSGNESGPTMKSNYTDPTILNKDYYYYQGKCYGFCQ